MRCGLLPLQPNPLGAIPIMNRETTLSSERLGIYLPIPRNGSFRNVPIEDLTAADWKLLAEDQPETGWRWAERLARLAAGQLQQILLAEADLRKVRELLHERRSRDEDVVAPVVADAAGEVDETNERGLEC